MTDPFHTIAAYTRLESLLEAIPDAALLIDLDKTILASNRKFRSQFSNHESVNGKTCYEVCHFNEEPCHLSPENCPMEECLIRRRSVQALHVHKVANRDCLTSVTMRPLTDLRGEPERVCEQVVGGDDCLFHGGVREARMASAAL